NSDSEANGYEGTDHGLMTPLMGRNEWRCGRAEVESTAAEFHRQSSGSLSKLRPRLNCLGRQKARSDQFIARVFRPFFCFPRVAQFGHMFTRPVWYNGSQSIGGKRAVKHQART